MMSFFVQSTPLASQTSDCFCLLLPINLVVLAGIHQVCITWESYRRRPSLCWSTGFDREPSWNQHSCDLKILSKRTLIHRGIFSSPSCRTLEACVYNRLPGDRIFFRCSSYERGVAGTLWKTCSSAPVCHY